MNTSLLTVNEVAHALRVDATTVRRWIKAGALPAVILPHQHSRQAYRVRQSALQQILAGTLHPSQDPPPATRTEQPKGAQE